MIIIRPIDFDPESNYKDAINSRKWEETRQALFERDGFKCRFCGCTENLQGHHILYHDEHGNPDFFNLDNLITLCAPCHEIVTNAVNAVRHSPSETINFDVSVNINLRTRLDELDKKLNEASAHAATNQAWKWLYDKKQELIVNTLFLIWKRSLKSDSNVINMRNKDVKQPIADVVIFSIEFQTGIEINVSYINKTNNKITEYLARAYIHYASEGTSDSDFIKYFGLNYGKLQDVKNNAQKLKCGLPIWGTDASG